MFLLWWSIKQNLLQSKEILVGGKEKNTFSKQFSKILYSKNVLKEGGF